MLLQEGVTAQAQARPEATALVFKDTRLTYGALEEASNRLAWMLIASGCRREDRVGLLMPKMPTAIVAMLGVLKADAIYVPLDPAGPPGTAGPHAGDKRLPLHSGGGPGLGDAARSVGDGGPSRAARSRWLDEEIVPEADAAPAFTLRDLSAYPPTAPRSATPTPTSAHSVHIGIHGTAEGGDDHPRKRVQFLRWAGKYFGIAPSDRISSIRRCISTCRHSISSDRFGRAELHLVPRELNVPSHKLAHSLRRLGSRNVLGPSVLTSWGSSMFSHQGDFQACAA